MIKVGDLGKGLKGIHEISVKSSKDLTEVKQKMAVNVESVLKLTGKAKKLKEIKAQLEKEIRRFALADKMVNEALNKGEFADALDLNDKMLLELEAYLQKKKEAKEVTFSCLYLLYNRFTVSVTEMI